MSERPLGLPLAAPSAADKGGPELHRLTGYPLHDNRSHLGMDRVKEMPRGAAHVERWCAEFERACRGRGVRVTPQRVAVYRALAEDATHPTAEQVYARLRPDLPSLSPATVYRILDSLERERLIRRVGATRGVGRYDANLEPHQHVVCRRCGRMTDVQMPALSALTLRERAVPGFVVEGLDIRIVGRCATCRRPH